MILRGADAAAMVEYTEAREHLDRVLVDVYKTFSPGDFIAAAAGDIAQGETILRAGQLLTSREIGCLAIGRAEACVWRKPTVAIFSTGDELVSPGETRFRGGVYDSNSAILSAAEKESISRRTPVLRFVALLRDAGCSHPAWLRLGGHRSTT